MSEPPNRLPARIGWGSLFLVNVSLFLITGLAFSLGVLGLGFLLAILVVSAIEARAWFYDQEPLIAAMQARLAAQGRDDALIQTVAGLSDRAGIPRPRLSLWPLSLLPGSSPTTKMMGSSVLRCGDYSPRLARPSQRW